MINSKNKILEDLILDISNGNKNSLSALYEYTKKDIFGFAISILKNTHEAEDILHEVYIKIYENAGTYQKGTKPLTWILTITKNLSLMRIRKNKYHLDIDDLCETLGDHNNQIEDKLFIETIFEYITDEERNILMLHSTSGFKHREIAKILDLPLSTVLSKYNRAIKKIKKRMATI